MMNKGQRDVEKANIPAPGILDRLTGSLRGYFSAFPAI
jgi:hypothetical protein